MEKNLYTNEENPSSKPTLTVLRSALPYLDESAKWGKFLGICGFVGSGLLVLFGLFFGTLLSFISPEESFDQFKGLMGVGMAIIYSLIGIVYFFPSLYLYRFSIKTQKAIQIRDNEVLASAFENQKSLYKFMGILMVITLGIYAFIFLFSILGAFSELI